MSRIFEQISNKTEIDDKRNHVIVTFPKIQKTFSFNIDRRRVVVGHKSQAVIAAVTGRVIKYKGMEIESTNKVFDWLGVEYTIEYKDVEPRDEGSISGDIISYF